MGQSRALPLAVFLLLLAGCKVWHVQVYKPEAIGLSKSENMFTYENDTLGINYFFWADGGNMRFRIYNKSSKPIYIDWKKSNYISNSYKYDYWSDKTQSTTLSSSLGRYFSYKDSVQFPKIVGYSTISNSVSVGSTVTVKQERITFIPPKSYIIRYVNYKIMTDYYHFVDGDRNFTRETEPLNEISKDSTKVVTKSFDKDNTPLDFRNFLTLSFKEDFGSEFYVDNEFYIKEIKVMDARHFSYYRLDKNTNEPVEVFPYKEGTDFYKRIN